MNNVNSNNVERDVLLTLGQFFFNNYYLEH